MQFLPELPQISRCMLLSVPFVIMKTILEDKTKNNTYSAFLDGKSEETESIL